MLRDFKKNSFQMLKKATGIGLSVLFAVNAALTTAHAISGKDILHGAGCDDPKMAAVLDKHIKLASGGAPVVFLDMASLHIPTDNKGRPLDPSELRESIKRQLIQQVKNTDVDSETQGKIIKNPPEPIKHPDAIMVGDTLVIPGPRQTFIEGPTDGGIVFTHIQGDALAKLFSKSSPFFCNMTETQKHLLSVFVNIHEAAHCNVKQIEFDAKSQSLIDQKVADEDTPQNGKVGPFGDLHRATKLQTATEMFKENQSDIAGFDAVLEAAPTKEDALKFMKCFLAMRADNPNDGAHFNLHELSTYINKLDPTYPVFPDLTIDEQSQVTLELIRSSHSDSSFGEPMSDAAKIAQRIVKIGQDLSKQQQVRKEQRPTGLKSFSSAENLKR